LRCSYIALTMGILHLVTVFVNTIFRIFIKKT
jgi:hypothetical protein